MVLHLALEVDGAGAHPGAASATAVPLDRLLSADHLRRTVAAAQNYYRADPLYLWLPVLAITVLVLALSLLGDSIRDAFDPRTRR